MIENNDYYSLSGQDNKFASMAGVIDSRDTPRDTDSQEHVDRVTAGHVAHTCIRVFILAGRHFAREGVWNW